MNQPSNRSSSSPAASASAGSSGPPTRHSGKAIAGTVLARAVVPAWLAMGAFMKISAMDPRLLPVPVRSAIEWCARSLDVSIVDAYIPALRIIVGMELALALTMVVAGRISRGVAITVLSVFCTLLTGILIFSDGKCNCMGPGGPPAAAMLAIDGALLLGVIFLPTVGSRMKTGATIGAVLAAIVVGIAIAFAWPDKQASIAPPPVQPPPIAPVDPPVAPANPPTDQVKPPDQPAKPPDAPVQPAPAGVAPWPAQPEAIQNHYIFDANEWLGKRLDSQPIAIEMTGLGSFNPNKGRIHIVFMRDDCDHCHELLETYFSGPLPTPTISVAIQDIRSGALPNPCENCVKVKTRGNADAPIYMITTPVLMTIKDGIVIAICDDPENPEKVRATLEAGK